MPLRHVVRSARMMAAVAAVLMAAADHAWGADGPVAGTALSLKRSGSLAERLVFVSKDALLPFPAFGGPDDPRTTGLTIELISPVRPTATLTLAAGTGTPGWTVKDGASRDSYKFGDKLAGAASPIALVQMKEGKLLKIMARAAGFPLSAPTGPVAIRITMGSLRICARFRADTIRTDKDATYVAAKATTFGLYDCSSESLGAYDATECALGDLSTSYGCGGACPPGAVCATRDLSTCTCIDETEPCGSTAPACNGACPDGEACMGIGGYILPRCGCLPIGSTPCGTSQCGGDCPPDMECNYFVRQFQTGCECGGTGPCGVDGDDCPPGSVCHQGRPGSFCIP